MIRLSELLFATRLSADRTRFSLVFHSEGLVNPKIVQRLEAFGKGLENMFRPLLAVITPACPQYMVDPLADRIRTDFLPQRLSQSAERGFEESIKRLAAYYDVGYHGHFFSEVGGRYRPAFDDEAVPKQFEGECRHLANLGFRPGCYAGGWWFISPTIVSLLQSWRFSLDTSINDLHRDSFSRPQPYPDSKVGRPHWLAEEVLEIPTVRSLNGLWEVTVRQRRSTNFVVVSLHDYDMLWDQKALNRLLKKFVVADRLLSVPQLVEASRVWLSSLGGKR